MEGFIRTINGLRNRPLHGVTFGLFILGLTFAAACNVTGVEKSPDPGIIQVHLQSAPGDTVITIGKERLVVSEGDQFQVSVFQGRVVKDSTYAILYKNLADYQEEEHAYNLLEKTATGTTANYQIFNTYIPPGVYKKLEFGLTAEQIRIGNFSIPVDLPPDVGSIIAFDFEKPVEVNSNDTTVVNLQIRPFKSINRYRDSFRFERDVSITKIQHK